MEVMELAMCQSGDGECSVLRCAARQRGADSSLKRTVNVLGPSGRHDGRAGDDALVNWGVDTIVSCAIRGLSRWSIRRRRTGSGEVR